MKKESMFKTMLLAVVFMTTPMVKAHAGCADQGIFSALSTQITEFFYGKPVAPKPTGIAAYYASAKRVAGNAASSAKLAATNAATWMNNNRLLTGCGVVAVSAAVGVLAYQKYARSKTATNNN